MDTFFRVFAIVTAWFLVAGAPAIIVAWRRGRGSVTQGFILTAVILGVFFGLVAASSEQLVSGCSASGGIACLDVGYQGLLFFIGLVHLAASLLVANHLARG